MKVHSFFFYRCFLHIASTMDQTCFHNNEYTQGKGETKMQQILPEYPERKRRAQKKAEKAFELKQIKTLAEGIPGAVCVFLLAMADCFSVNTCFPLAFLVACKAWTGKAPKGACAGMIAAEVMRLIWGIEGAWAETAVYMLISVGIAKPVVNRKKVYALMVLGGGMGILPIFLANDPLKMLAACAGLALSVGCMPAMLRTTEIITSKKRALSEDDLLCMALPVMLLVCGGCHVQIGQMNVGLTAAAFLTVYAGWACGATAGAAVGIGAGFSALMGNMHALYMVVLPFSGFLCGCLRRKNRFLGAAAYIFAAVCVSGAAMRTVPQALLLNLLISCAAFACLPERLNKKGLWMVRQLQWEKPRENVYLSLRMRRWVKAIDKLTEALPSAQEPVWNIALDAEGMAEEVCENCEMLPICWRDHYTETKKSMEALASCNETDLNLINRYFSHCKRIGKLPGIMERVAERRNGEYRRYAVAAYERDMLKTHLTALSHAAQMISLEGSDVHQDEHEWQERAEEALQMMRFSGRIAFVKQVDGHKTLGIQCDMIALHPVMGEKLAEQLSAYLGTRLCVTEQNATQVLLEEKPPMTILWGKAACCAADENEYGSQHYQANGDAVKVRFLNGGKVLLALSDGMGHGERAKTESKNTLDMLCSCIEAGYSCDQAMKAVNGAMLSSTGGELFATVDLCLLDLWTGKAVLHKSGAAASAVIQGQKAHWITAAALPLGIMENVIPMEKEIALAEYDRLLLFTDGVTDVFDGEQALMTAIQRHLDEDPGEMAQSLMEEAVARDGGYPKDDMTVVCVQIVSSYPERKRRAGVM